MPGGNIKWTGNLSRKLALAEGKAVGYLVKTTQYYSLMGEANMKRRARWTDRSGNARNGLTGEYTAKTAGRKREFQIDLYYTVPYGLYLESIKFRKKKKLAVIQPTINFVGPRFRNAAGKVIVRMFA